MKPCEYCIKRDVCTRDTGIIYGGCNVDYKPDTEAVYKRLDSLESCKDNPVYAKHIKELRALLVP